MDLKALQQMLSGFRQMQERMEQQMQQLHVEASAGGGMVLVRMNGRKQVVEVRIEPEVFAEKDAELLQDLIRAAVNDAARRVDEQLADQMKDIAGNIAGLPGGMKIPGLF
jgi:DNA-binding YbaB/EbfC family protein